MHGMSLRDWFAGEAIGAVIERLTSEHPDQIAERCYLIANAMIAERQKHL